MTRQTLNGELCTWFDKLEFCFLFFSFIEKLYPPVQVRAKTTCFFNPGAYKSWYYNVIVRPMMTVIAFR